MPTTTLLPDTRCAPGRRYTGAPCRPGPARGEHAPLLPGLLHTPAAPPSPTLAASPSPAPVPGHRPGARAAVDAKEPVAPACRSAAHPGNPPAAPPRPRVAHLIPEAADEAVILAWASVRVPVQALVDVNEGRILAVRFFWNRNYTGECADIPPGTSVFAEAQWSDEVQEEVARIVPEAAE
ncbi:hypothetical protein DB346_15550 [Verrucomicrobia bacterium LW23]|nr:hypothetical protein DB346_15550 [Verrucomicrobia bacterium LW23]